MDKRLAEVIMKAFLGKHKMHKSKLLLNPKFKLITMCGSDSARFMTLAWEDVTCKKCRKKEQ